jgi:uncharacterized protein YndB with AHSA1/START domain
MDTPRRNDLSLQRETTFERKSECEIVITRIFDSAVNHVFKAWSEPDLFKEWWVPRSMGIALESCEMRVQTGGTYRLSFGEGMDFFGRYIEVVPHSRIVWTNDESGANGPVTTVTFTGQGDQTLLMMSERYPSEAALDAVGAGSADAAHETFNQLDALLAEMERYKV